MTSLKSCATFYVFMYMYLFHHSPSSPSYLKKLRTTSLCQTLDEIVFKHTLLKISYSFDTENICSCLAYLHLRILLLTNSIKNCSNDTLVDVLVYHRLFKS